MPDAETPSWEEFWAYCQQIGLTSEPWAKDKFLAAEQEQWTRMRHWRAYAARARAWWESEGRPSGLVDPGANMSPWVLEKMRERKRDELRDLEEAAEEDDGLRRDPAQKARRVQLRGHITQIDGLLDRAAGLT